MKKSVLRKKATPRKRPWTTPAHTKLVRKMCDLSAENERLRQAIAIQDTIHDEHLCPAVQFCEWSVGHEGKHSFELYARDSEGYHPLGRGRKLP